MTLPNPKFAPRRNDLPWLRRRRKAPVPKVAETPAARAPRAEASPPAASPPPRPAPTRSEPPRPTGPKIDYTRRDRPSQRPAPAPPPAPAPTSPPPAPRPAAASTDSSLDLSLDLSSPAPAPSPPPAAGASTSLDLDGGTPAPPSSPASSSPASSSPASSPPASSTSLDLGGGTPAPPSPPASSTSLDLGAPADPSPRTARRAAPPPAAADRHHVTRRTRHGVTTLLDFGRPVVTLDRLQSGIGALTIDAVVGDEVGDLRIGAAWALADARTGTVELDAGRRHGPEGRSPVVWAQREGRFERIAVDLRQARSFRRLLVYGFSAGRGSLQWGGTMVVTTYGGDRIDAPIVSAPSPAVLALLSIYNVDGEFVVRSEMDPVSGSVRDTCRAFGYDRITWLDDRTPVT